MVNAPLQSEFPSVRIPPLENGDCLTRLEFERRYAAMPELKKAELIEGTVYMASPLRFEPHAEPHADLMGWLWTYKTATPGVRLGDNPTVRLDLDNELQPDAALLIDAPCGGHSTLGPEGYVEGAPELVVEVAASSATIDLGNKKHAYRRNGVKEYLVWIAFEREIVWFGLEAEQYRPLLVDENGIVRSQVFPGLWLDVGAMLQGNMTQVLAVLQAGLATEAHQHFVTQLQPITD